MEMHDLLRGLYTRATILLLRPYIRRELPGWGRLYRAFVGTYPRDPLWRTDEVRWVRGKLHGYEMSARIGGWSNRATYFLERFYDLPTQLLLKAVLKPGDTFVDVGANEGMMSLLASHLVGPDGRVIAFEPNPEARTIFEQSIRRNGIGNIDLRPAGLGSAAGEFELFVPDINSGQATFTNLTGLAGRTVSCPVRVGDEELRDERPRLIKIDVEGFETHVLEGLRATLSRGKPVVVMEMIAEHLARDSSSPGRLIELLESMGYRGHRLGLVRKGRSQRLTYSPLPSPWSDGDYVWIHESEPALPPISYPW